MSGGRFMLRLGSVCNNRCEHCQLREVATLPERTTADAVAELRRGRELGHDQLVLLRGETTMRGDLAELVREARALGYHEVHVQTNGRLLGEALLADLRAAGVTHFKISLFGPDAAIHDAVANSPGAFAETRRGIVAALAAGFPVQGSIPAVAATVRHLADTVALLGHLGVRDVRVSLVRPNDSGARVAAPLDVAVPHLRAAALLGRELGLAVSVDGVPPCLLGGVDDALLRYHGEAVTVVDLHRGPTDLPALRRIYRPRRDACERCGEVEDCPLIWHAYVEEMGCERRLQPFPLPEEPEVDVCLLHAPWVLLEEPVPRQWDLLHLVPEAAPDQVDAQAAEEFAELPMGLESIRRYLEARRDGRVRVVNLAGLYAGAPEPHARVTNHLARLRARVFAVDFHWLAHCQGALEVLRLCRQLHPAARTVVGGMSATHFAQPLMEQHGFIDFVVAGDGERPMLKLLDVLLGGGDLSTVPNLWYRRHGRVMRSRGTYFAEEESDYRGLDFVPVRRGCAYDCTHCGVGHTATQALFGARARYRYAPEKVANELLAQVGPGGRARVVGDPLLTLGPGGMRRLLAAIGRRGLDLDLGVEFQLMHATGEIERLARSFRSVRIAIRPDTGDEQVRRAQGKPYSNDDLLRCVAAAAERDNVSVALTFTLGLAGDDAGSLERTLALARHLVKLPAKHPIELGFQELWYLQPGSRALADPSAHGYRAECTDLESLRRRLTAPLLAGVLHFSPGGLDRRGYADLVQRKHAQVNQLLHEAGRRSDAAFRGVNAYVDAVSAFVDRYERHGPGGLDLPPAEARRLGAELRAAFLERALAPVAAGTPPVTAAAAAPAAAVEYAPGPLQGERRDAVLRAIGAVAGGVQSVRAGRGELHLELPAGGVTLSAAGSRSSATARSDCFDLIGPRAPVESLRRALGVLERDHPERLPLLFLQMAGAPTEPGAFPGARPLMITTACNQRCVFCTLGPGDRAADAESVLAAIARGADGPAAVFGGGEPTLDDRLAEYLRAARGAGYSEVVVETNAVRCADGRYARRLAANGLTTAVVSLHAHTARVSDAITRTPGSFEQTIAGIDALIDADVFVWLSLVLCTRNAGEVEEFVHYADRRFPELAGLSFSVLAPVGEGSGVAPLWPRLRDVTPRLIAGLALASGLGLPVRVREPGGVPLCFLRGFERFSECLRRPPADGADPERLHAAACTACRWRPVCSGWWRAYLERFGEAELVAAQGPPPELPDPAA